VGEKVEFLGLSVYGQNWIIKTLTEMVNAFLGISLSLVGDQRLPKAQVPQRPPRIRAGKNLLHVAGSIGGNPPLQLLVSSLLLAYCEINAMTSFHQCRSAPTNTSLCLTPSNNHSFFFAVIESYSFLPCCTGITSSFSASMTAILPSNP
jgi:hypothetical protein